MKFHYNKDTVSIEFNSDELYDMISACTSAAIKERLYAMVYSSDANKFESITRLAERYEEYAEKLSDANDVIRSVER